MARIDQLEEQLRDATTTQERREINAELNRTYEALMSTHASRDLNLDDQGAYARRFGSPTGSGWPTRDIGVTEATEGSPSTPPYPVGKLVDYVEQHKHARTLSEPLWTGPCQVEMINARGLYK